MSEITKGPWIVSDSRPNDYALSIHGAQTGDSGFPVVADVCERTVNGTHQSNARRIVTCVNACEGLPQDALDGGWTAAGISAYAARLEQQNAILLDACRKALYAIKGREHTGFLEDAIAKAGA